jgi:hypothetical protein
MAVTIFSKLPAGARSSGILQGGDELLFMVFAVDVILKFQGFCLSIISNFRMLIIVGSVLVNAPIIGRFVDQ